MNNQARGGRNSNCRWAGILIVADQKAVGLPELPGPWPTWLLKKPLEGRITGLDRRGNAVVNLGARDGIRSGMEFWVDAKGGAEIVSVEAVEPESCHVAIKESALPRNGFRMGQRVLSRIPARVLEDRPVRLR